MRKWGLVVSLFFGAVILALLVPTSLLLASKPIPKAHEFLDLYEDLATWICVGTVIAGQALLLWLKVDTTQKRLKPRTRLLLSAITTGLFLAILTLSIIFCAGLGIRGDKFMDILPDTFPATAVFICYAGSWLVWGIVFYRLYRNSDDPVSRAVTWLLRGSVLELLIAVPAHVVARRRDDCSAPVVTSYGIAAGLAIMLISFGPGVLLLYRKRMERYTRNPAGK